MALRAYKPIFTPDANDLTMGKMLEKASLLKYIHPEGSHMTLSSETLRKWLYRYQHLGITGLKDKPRSDKGRHQIPDKISSQMLILRMAHPRWTTRMIKELAKIGIWNGRKPTFT